jgi:CheY-like chemotaxis protein
LINLIGNGLKFHHEEATASVIVNVIYTGSMIRCNIVDSGVGISLEQQSKLFQHFVQLNNSVSRLYGGTGLGLSICKHIMECMGGRIWLENSQLDVGSTFSFEFEAHSCIEDEITETREAKCLILARRRSLSEVQRVRKVLVAEDNAINRKVMRKMLDTIGIRNVLIVDGQKAVEAFKKDAYDIVILDLGMPVLNGVEAATAIRQHEDSTGVILPVPIVACTADATATLHDECIRVGMNEVLTKPLVKDSLKYAMARLLQ